MPARALTYRWFAKTYGWDPDQVESLDLELQEWLPVIEEAAHEAQEFLTRQSTKAPQRPNGR